MWQHGMDIGDDGCVRTVGVRGLGCAHGGERGCDCRDSQRAVQLRQYGCTHAFFGLVDVVVLSLGAAPLVSVSSLDNSNLAKSAGSTLTINGLGFGASNFTPTSSLTTSDNCFSTAWTSVTAVTCAPRSYSAGTQLTSVIARGATSTWTTMFTFDGIHAEPSLALIQVPLAVGCAAPVVSSSDPINMALSGGGIITIGGLSFADSANFTPTSSIWMSGVCGSTAWTSLTAVSCAARAYNGVSLRLGVTLSATAGTRSARFSFDGASGFLR